MKTRNLLILVVVAALVAGGIWYYMQPAPTEPMKAAEAPKPAAPATTPAPVAPKPLAPSVVVAPKAPVVQAAAPKPAPASANANADSIKELDTTMTDMVTMLQAGDMMGLMDKYMPPEQLAQMPPEIRTQMQQQMAQNPQMQQQLQLMATALQSLQGQTPTFNDAGDKATYQMTPPAGMVPPGANVPATIPVSFVKINGRWYTSNDGRGF